MPGPDHQTNLRDHTLLLGVFILWLCVSPLLAWWTSPTNHWYLPYLVWLGIILLIAWVHYRHHEP
jgi:hypothetical protein